METHLLRARKPDGRTIDVGYVRSLEQAVRLERALACVSDEVDYWRFEYVELDEPPMGRSLTYGEAREPLTRQMARKMAAAAARR